MPTIIHSKYTLWATVVAHSTLGCHRIQHTRKQSAIPGTAINADNSSSMCNISANSNTAELNILLLGLDAAGKTELVAVLSHTERIDFSPTVGCRSDRLHYDGRAVRLTELGGARDVRDIWHHYFADAHAAIFLVDSADHKRILLARHLLAQIMLRSQLSGKPLLVVCSKQDDPTALDYLDCCTYLDVERMANVARTPCFLAALGRGDTADLEAGMRWLLDTVARNMRRIRNQNEYFSMCAPETRARLQSSRSLTPRRRVTRALEQRPAEELAVAERTVRLNSAPARDRRRRRRRVAPASAEGAS